MNLWQIITNNSTLPIQSGNNLWLHLNNQQGVSTGGLVPIPYSDIIIEDKVDSVTFIDYSDVITLLEERIPSITMEEQLIILSFEE